MADQDTEITLGSGKILGLFFALVVLCGLFFGAGYTLGKNAAPPQVTSADALSPSVTTNNGPKPSPNGLGQVPAKQDCATADCAQGNSNELTFYKAVEQKNPDAQLTTEPQAQSPAEQKATPPEVAKNSAQPGSLSSGGYIVQIAAVSKQQDADALVSALRRKQYSVAVVTVPTDKLFHVQAGPFLNPTEAEAIRNRLVGDGYNPILKR